MVFCLLLAFSTGSMYAQSGIVKSVKQTLKIGDTYKLKIDPSTAPYGSKGKTAPVYNDFKIVTSVDGSLTLSFETFAEMTTVALFNENGVSLEPASKEIVTGSIRWKYFGSGTYASTLQWNPTVEKLIGSFTFKLDAGTYYLRLHRSQKGLSNATISLTLKDLDGNEVNPTLFRP